jgi:prevent-host-death family protein
MTIRKIRESIGQLEEMVSESGEIVVTKRGAPIARIVPISGARPRPSHADLRRQIPAPAIASSELIRAERDER